MSPTEVPVGQVKGPIPFRGPSPVMPCGPCSLDALMAWEKLPKREKVKTPRPNIRGVKKQDLRTHLRLVHKVGLDGKPIPVRRQGIERGRTRAQIKAARR